jgi:hypothetical protein
VIDSCSEDAGGEKIKIMERAADNGKDVDA